MLIPKARPCDMTPEEIKGEFDSCIKRLKGRHLNSFNVDMIKGYAAEAILRMQDKDEYRHAIKDIIKSRDEAIEGYDYE